MSSVRAETANPPPPPERGTAANAMEATGSLQQALAHARRLLESDAALAVEQLHAVLQAVPEHPAALQLLAAAHSR